MRLTGGVLAGRRITVPPGIIRPAMDRMRESVFAVLGDIAGKSFLDLFTGSGIIALEAASRGAAPVEAVEGDTGKRAVLLANAAISPERISCHFMPAERYVLRYGGKKEFDYIFCDPPFPYQFKSDLVVKIAKSGLLHDDSLLLMHRPANEKIDEDAVSGSALALHDRRVYGRSVVDFWRKG